MAFWGGPCEFWAPFEAAGARTCSSSAGLGRRRWITPPIDLQGEVHFLECMDMVYTSDFTMSLRLLSARRANDRTLSAARPIEVQGAASLAIRCYKRGHNGEERLRHTALITDALIYVHLYRPCMWGEGGGGAPGDQPPPTYYDHQVRRSGRVGPGR